MLLLAAGPRWNAQLKQAAARGQLQGPTMRKLRRARAGQQGTSRMYTTLLAVVSRTTSGGMCVAQVSFATCLRTRFEDAWEAAGQRPRFHGKDFVVMGPSCINCKSSTGSIFYQE